MRKICLTVSQMCNSNQYVLVVIVVLAVVAKAVVVVVVCPEPQGKKGNIFKGNFQVPSQSRWQGSDADEWCGTCH